MDPKFVEAMLLEEKKKKKEEKKKKANNKIDTTENDANEEQ